MDVDDGCFHSSVLVDVTAVDAHEEEALVRALADARFLFCARWCGVLESKNWEIFTQDHVTLLNTLNFFRVAGMTEEKL
eukprot:1633453-Pleurochrysis_carterae.AAC.1